MYIALQPTCPDLRFMLKLYEVPIRDEEAVSQGRAGTMIGTTTKTAIDKKILQKE